MQIPYTIIIDLARPMKSNTILISENDRRSRLLKIILMNNGKKLDMSDVLAVTVKAVKADETIIFGDCTIVEDEEGKVTNTVIYALPEDMADVIGKSTFTLTLNSDTAEQITTPEFYVKVNRQLYDEEDYISASDMTGFSDLMGRSLAAAKAAEGSKDAAADSATEAGSYAAKAASSEEAAKKYEELIKDQVQNEIRGPSAYQVAVENGYTGTEEEWLESLKGEDGEKGAKGDPGLFMMSVNESGHLIVSYNDNEPAPPLEIVDGRLVYTIS